MVAALALLAFLAVAPFTHALPPSSGRWHTNATYINNATTVAADPYVRWDASTGAYWAYSTEGADPGWYFGVYTSPDLNTWRKIPGGAIKNDSLNVWAEDWWWAPECYYNVSWASCRTSYSAYLTSGDRIGRNGVVFPVPCWAVPEPCQDRGILQASAVCR